MFVTLDFINLRFNQGRIEVLLSKRDNKDLPEYGKFSIQGGMVWEESLDNSGKDDDLEQASSRIIRDKLGLSPSYVEQLQAVGSSTRDSRGWSVTLPHLSLLSPLESHIDDDKFRWIDIANIDTGMLPFDHYELLTKGLSALKNKAKYTSVLLYLLNDKFTIANAVEIFSYFNLKVSKQTIHSRWVKSGLIIETGQFSQNSKGGKPASLYQLSEKELSYFDIAIGSMTE